VPIEVTIGFVVNPGAALPVVALPKTVLAAALLKLNVNAGVVVDVATLVVNSGDSVPALNEVTVPLPPLPFAAAVISPLALTVMFALVNDPTLELTVARVSALEPLVVASPLSSLILCVTVPLELAQREIPLAAAPGRTIP
jgi:hypothetical protein